MNDQTSTTPSVTKRGRRAAKRGRAWIYGMLQVVLDRTEPAVEWLIRLCGWSAILLVFGIFFFVFREALPMLGGKLNLSEFFTSPEWRPTAEPEPHYGILALLLGSLSVTALAMLMAVPLGLGAAVFISEFSGGRVRETLKVLIELLAAIPSVVWGFIGYMVLGPIIIRLTGAPVGVCLLNGGIILALMSVPIIVSVGEDALRRCPIPIARRPCRWAPAAGRSSTACSSRRPRTGCWPRCSWASAVRSAKRWPS